jgi:hypothetical protein
MAEDITIRIPPEQAESDAAKINASVESIERTATKVGTALGAEISKGTQQAVNVVHSSTNTINRAMDSITAKIRATGVSAPTPIQQVEALRMQGISRTSGDARAFEQINAAAAAQTRILQENAAAQLKAAAAAEQHNRTMRASDEQWSRFRANAMGAKQALDNLRISEERAATSNARYIQQQALIGRTPTERRDIQRQQEHEAALAGSGMDPANRAALIASYGAANARLAEQDKLQKEAAISARSMNSEFKNAVERLGAAFVAYQLYQHAIVEGIVGTAMAAARTETLGVAMEAAGKTNNIAVTGLHMQEAAIKKLGITTEDARQALIRMMVVEIDTANATKLARLAQDAAVISNINSSDAFQQMIYGIQSGQVRVLRTIGINVQFAESYQKLAVVLGKNVLELTEQEKAQARVNEVLRVAPQYAGIYEQSMTSVGKQMTSLKRYFKEAQDAIGKEFLPQLGVAVRTLTELAKLGEEHPKAGSVLALLGGGLAVTAATKFLLGTTAATYAGAGVAAGVNMAATNAFAQAAADKLTLTIFGTTKALQEFKNEYYGVAVPGWITWLEEHLPKVFKDAADELRRLSGVPLPGDSAFAKMLEQRTKETTDVIKKGVDTDTAKIYQRDLDAYLKVSERKIWLTNMVKAAEQAVSDARDSSNKRAYVAALAQQRGYEAELEAIERYKRNEELLITLRDTSNRKEHESMKESFSMLDQINKAQMEKGQLNQAYATLAKMSFAEYTKEIEIQRAAWDKLTLASLKFYDANMDANIAGATEKFKAISEEYINSSNQRDKLLVGAGRSDIERQAQAALRLSEGAGGSSVSAIEQAYSIRIQLAHDLYDYEVTQAEKISAIGEKSVAITRAWTDQKAMLDEATISRAESLIRLQQEHFDALKRSFEGLFDAAFEGAKSFTNALKRMMMAVFLTPIKEQMSRMFAGMFMGMQGQAGGGGAGAGGSGILSRIFNVGGSSNTTNRVSETLNLNVTGGGGGINSVRLINGAVPVVIVGTAAAASTGGGGTATAIGAGAGAGFLGGLLSRAPRTIGGEVIGAGGSTTGLTRDASGLWLRGAGAGEGAALAGGAATGMAGLPTYGGGFGGAGLPGMMPGWAGSTTIGAGGTAGGGFGGMLKGMNWGQAAQGLALMGGMGLLSAGIQRRSSPMTVAGGAAMGYGMSGMMGMTGLGGAITGAGGGLAAAGLMRGGVSGLGMSTAGGALIGMQFGGPIGALIGGAIGLGAGIVRLFIKSADEKVQDKVRATYGLTIPKSIAKQIVQFAKEKYGGSLDMAVRAPETRELLRLYGQTMGMKLPTSLMFDVARSASLIQSRGELFQGAQYDNGQAYTYASNLRAYNGISGMQLPTMSPTAGAGGQPVQVFVSPQATVNLWRTGTAAAIQGDPRGVAQSAMRGATASNVRSGNAVLTLAPSVITH